MGYGTPNIDRIANEGAMFTHYYAQQSCTAGCASYRHHLDLGVWALIIAIYLVDVGKDAFSLSEG